MTEANTLPKADASVKLSDDIIASCYEGCDPRESDRARGCIAALKDLLRLAEKTPNDARYQEIREFDADTLTVGQFITLMYLPAMSPNQPRQLMRNVRSNWGRLNQRVLIELRDKLDERYEPQD